MAFQMVQFCFVTLSELMKLSMSEIYEVASFYAHFHIMDEDNISVPDVTIKVCESITCAMNESEKLYHNIKLKYKNCRVEKAPCMGRCNYAPVVEVNHNHILNADNSKILKAKSSVEEGSLLLICLAKIRAQEVFPTPRGPQNKSACAN